MLGKARLQPVEERVADDDDQNVDALPMANDGEFGCRPWSTVRLSESSTGATGLIPE